MALIVFTNMFFISNQKIEDSSSILVVGDSHLMNAINPQLLASAKNISQSGEPYALTLWKLKQIVPKSRPDTVFIGFSHENLAGFQDFKFLDSRWSGEMALRAYPIFKFTDLLNYEVNWSTFIKTFIKNMCLYPKKNHTTYLGKFANNKGVNLETEKIHATIHKQYFKYEKQNETNLNTYFLDSCISYLQNQKIHVVLISSPVHKSYYKQIPQKYKEWFGNKSNKFKKIGVSVWDYTQDNRFMTDSLYFNADHMNSNGASIFTSTLQQDMIDVNN